MDSSISRRRKACALAALALFAAGCTSFAPDGRFGPVRDAVKERTGAEPVWLRGEADAAVARESVARLLAQPLDAEAAVRIALLNNKSAQASFGELGVAEADLVEAGRPRNPILSLGRLRRGDEVEVERSIVFDVLGLFSIPLSMQSQERRLASVQATLAGEVLRLAADTRRAWVRAVAAGQSVRYMEQVRDAAESGAELARRMEGAGNFSRLAKSREQAFHAEAVLQLARARQAAVAERERLTRLMGLSSPNQFRLPERLPDLPRAARPGDALEAEAMERRLDLQAIRSETDGLAASLGLARITGYVNVLEAGWRHNSETGQPRQTGPELEFSLPIFDWSGARAARAQQRYLQALNRAEAAAVDARSQVRESYHGYQTAFELARQYRDEIVPLRKLISEENVLRYNGMLISVFELLADAREQVGSVNAYIEALRDFWEADTALQSALTGGGGGSALPTLRAATSAAPAAGAAH